MNTKKTILDRAIDALEDYLNAGHKELRRQAAEKAKKVYEDYYGTPYKNREEVKASLKKDKRQELIDSLPHWLRERADELFCEGAKSLVNMGNIWYELDEGYYFWEDCNEGKFDYALANLKQSNPEVYKKHYARFFHKEDRIYVPDSIKVLIDGAGILNGSKQLHYSHSFNDWFVIRKPSDSLLMQRPYLEKAEELEVGKVYFVKWKYDSEERLITSRLAYYCIYLGGGEFVYWDGSNVIETSFAIKRVDFCEVKDENN